MVKPTKTRTTSTKTAAKTTKSATRSASTTAASPKSTAPKPVIVTETTPVVTDPALKKKELIDTVTEVSGIKRKDAKPVIEAMLEVLGKTLAEGREMNLQPLGKVKINRTKEVQGGTVMITKIRQSNRAAKPASDPAATAAE